MKWGFQSPLSFNNIIKLSFICFFFCMRGKKTLYSQLMIWRCPVMLRHSSITAAQSMTSTHAPLSQCACQHHTTSGLCALHFVPAPSYGKVHWDYVQNSVCSAGAYTSHHKSDSHWEACNTSPAEPDKPSILPFISATIILQRNIKSAK